jgi:hypothetical protein
MIEATPGSERNGATVSSTAAIKAGSVASIRPVGSLKRR